MRILRATIVGLLAVAAFPGSAFAAPANQANVRQEVSTFVAQHPGAKQISGDTVQAGEGHFITFSTAASRTNAQAQASCPSNAYCWFEHAYYGGSIEWYTSHVGCGYSIGIYQILWGKASSWWNNSNNTINTNGGFFDLVIYQMRPHYSSVYVGDGNNDKNHSYCG